MEKKKKRIKQVLFLLILLCIVLFYPRKKYDLHEEDVSAVYMIHANQRWRLDREGNEAKIRDLVDKLNSMTLFYRVTFFKYGGIALSIVLEDSEGTTLDTYGGDGMKVTSSGSAYWVFGSDIDKEYMDWLCESAVHY